ncbi:hypothetical protein [Massilia sp. METH4]|uniref:hypothetical protein n=1 Tax=Massilia sp. METH4 TaxID=3123041 RepID=UPI0030D49060
MGDRFWSRSWQGSAPLVLWAAHFFFCYLVAAAGCRPWTWAVLLGATVVASVLAGWLAWTACHGNGAQGGLLGVARRWGAVLAFIAIVWGGLPLVVFGACA